MDNQAQMTGRSWTAVRADQAEPCQRSCAPGSLTRFDQTIQRPSRKTVRADGPSGHGPGQANQHHDAQATEQETDQTTQAMQTLAGHRQSVRTSSRNQGCDALRAPGYIDVRAVAHKLMGLGAACQSPTQTLASHPQSVRTSRNQGCEALRAPGAIDVRALALKLMGLDPTCQSPDCD